MRPAAQPAAAPPWTGDFSFTYLRRLLSTAQAACGVRLLADGPAADRPTLHVRHDIDLSLERALAMAEVEAEIGVPATFLVMVESPLYDLEEATTREVLHRLRALGHEVGLHMDLAEHGADPDLTIDALAALLMRDRRRLEEILGDAVRAVSFHRPPEPLVALLAGHEQLCGLANAYAAPLMRCYLADSAGSWRHGDPLPAVSDPPADVIQLLIHPFWWDDRHVAPADRLEAFFHARTAGRSPAATEAFDLALASVVRRIRRSGRA